jgi:ABC-type Fe3+/spermidine/putrescine transport system ATPase subunit
MIYVTHDQIEALSLSSRIVIMNQGVIEQNDRPETVYQQPATPFVAHFMGFDNGVTGTWSGTDGTEDVVTIAGRPFRCSRPATTGELATNQPVRLLFRPQDVRVLDGGDADATADNTLQAQVEFSNYQGTNTMVGLMAGEQRITASVDGSGYPAGTELLVRIDPQAIILDPTPQ